MKVEKLELDLTLSPDEMKEYLASLPACARKPINDALNDMIHRARTMQAMNLVLALKDKLTGGKPDCEHCGNEESVPEGVTIQ